MRNKWGHIYVLTLFVSYCFVQFEFDLLWHGPVWNLIFIRSIFILLVYEEKCVLYWLQHYNISIWAVFEIGMELSEDNFDLINQWRRGCREGKDTNFLEPSKSCKDQFTVGTECFNHGKNIRECDHCYIIWIIIFSMYASSIISIINRMVQW